MRLATLKEFLLTGTLGPLQGGLSIEEAFAGIGIPPDISPRDKPLITQQGSLQFGFHRKGWPKRLDFLGVYLQGEPLHLPGLVLSGWWPNHYSTPMEFFRFMDEEKIPYWPQASLCDDHLYLLCAGCGVHLAFGRWSLFSRQPSVNFTIDSLQYLPRSFPR